MIEGDGLVMGVPWIARTLAKALRIFTTMLMWLGRDGEEVD